MSNIVLATQNILFNLYQFQKFPCFFFSHQTVVFESSGGAKINFVSQKNKKNSTTKATKS
jgi:hypothetical protein